MLSCMLLEYHQQGLRSSGHARTHIANHFIIVVPIDHHLHNAVTVMDCCSLDTESHLHLSFGLLDHPAQQPSDTHRCLAVTSDDDLHAGRPRAHDQLRSACSLPSRTR